MADRNLPIEEEFKAVLSTGDDFNKQDDVSSEISDDDDDLSGKPQNRGICIYDTTNILIRSSYKISENSNGIWYKPRDTT